jgi:hypothetical protein
MALLHELGAETVLTVKGNQPPLYADLSPIFPIRSHASLEAETVERRGGRTEVHTIKASHEMNTYLASTWLFVAPVAQLSRTVTKAGTTTTQVVSLITTLISSNADPKHLHSLNRGHWQFLPYRRR